MSPGILGKKIGMTQVFRPDGQVVPVTVLKAGPCVVVQRKTPATDGYDAVQLGLHGVRQEVGRITSRRAGHFKKSGAEGVKFQREFRLRRRHRRRPEGRATACWSDEFKPKEKVDVIGVSKGRGFAGVVKRHHFRGSRCDARVDVPPGAGIDRRIELSVARVSGNAHGRADGQRDRVTVRNLEIVEVDAEDNVILVKGAVPGPNGGYVMVRRAKR